MKRHGNLIPEIVEWRNMDDAFDEVVSDLKGERPEAYQERKAEIIEDLQLRIGNGSFRIDPERVKQFYTEDGPKIRLIQSPDVIDRIGCNAVMRVVEKYLYPTVIRTSAASIKGRGMHRLFRKMRSDIRHDREGTANFYLCDIEKFYDNIDQQMVIDIVRTKIKDPVLLPILIDFITLLDRLTPPTAPIPYGHQRKKVVIPHREKGKGLCIGLRSSQCFGNLLLSHLGHRLKEREGVRYLYIYCDDIRVYGATKRWLWHIRDIIHEEIEGRLHLRIKRNEAVRPTTEGNDFLGYVDYGDHSRLRKRTKQKAARKLARVKSRKRRQELIGSFKGMAKWGDCHHLYKLLTGEKMAKEFKDFGLQYVADDGKKRFGGKSVSLRELQNMHITVIDYEKDVKTDNGLRRSWLSSMTTAHRPNTSRLTSNRNGISTSSVSWESCPSARQSKARLSATEKCATSLLNIINHQKYQAMAMIKIYGASERQDGLYKIGRKKYELIFGFGQDGESGYNFRKRYDHLPSREEIRREIEETVNAAVDERILTGFRWNETPVYLSQENQFNFKAAYDLAAQTQGATLPVKFKLGETADGQPQYHVFTDMAEFTDFYTKAIAFINQTLNEGWAEKDGVDYEAFGV